MPLVFKIIRPLYTIKCVFCPKRNSRQIRGVPGGTLVGGAGAGRPRSVNSSFDSGRGNSGQYIHGQLPQHQVRFTSLGWDYSARWRELNYQGLENRTSLTVFLVVDDSQAYNLYKGQIQLHNNVEHSWQHLVNYANCRAKVVMDSWCNISFVNFILTFVTFVFTSTKGTSRPNEAFLTNF